MVIGMEYFDPKILKCDEDLVLLRFVKFFFNRIYRSVTVAKALFSNAFTIVRTLFSDLLKEIFNGFYLVLAGNLVLFLAKRTVPSKSFRSLFPQIHPLAQ